MAARIGSHQARLSVPLNAGCREAGLRVYRQVVDAGAERHVVSGLGCNHCGADPFRDGGSRHKVMLPGLFVLKADSGRVLKADVRMNNAGVADPTVHSARLPEVMWPENLWQGSDLPDALCQSAAQVLLRLEAMLGSRIEHRSRATRQSDDVSNLMLDRIALSLGDGKGCLSLVTAQSGKYIDVSLFFMAAKIFQGTTPENTIWLPLEIKEQGAGDPMADTKLVYVGRKVACHISSDVLDGVRAENYMHRSFMQEDRLPFEILTDRITITLSQYK